MNDLTNAVSPPEQAGRPGGRIRSRRPGRRVLPWLPMAVIALLTVFAVVGPWLIPYGESQGSLPGRLAPPFRTGGDGAFHLLGTDQLGRDIFVRLAYGARVSLLVGVVGVALACLIGTMVGLLAGILNKSVDAALMRGTDVALSIPGLLIAILLASIFTPSIVTVFVSVGLLLWPTYARLIRGEVLVLKNSDFVALARVAGCSTWKIIVRHLLPNVLPSIIVLATLQIGAAVVLEASISFLGVGLPPNKASWGSMIDQGRQYMSTSWWLTAIPGLFIFLAVMSFNALGDWARVRFDPRLEGRR
ncbi:ABC transporter permease [Dactylosporangium sp. NPDC051484]|uniref:ABC transporter permease n=1 Tax=Dactylosporangium sp. NPDC051484 TaxID=3154942 RepID=UPI00344B2B39